MELVWIVVARFFIWRFGEKVLYLCGKSVNTTAYEALAYQLYAHITYWKKR